MPAVPPIFLAASNGGVGIDVVVWLIAGAIWLFTQMAAAKKKPGKPTDESRRASSARPPAGAAAGGGTSPTPDELAEIFKRLGADIPGTPPPAHPAPAPAIRAAAPVLRPAPTPRPRPGPRPAVPRAGPQPVPVPVPVRADLARRLAQARQESAAAAQRAEAERLAVNAIVHGVQSREGETRALDTSTQHTGTILPRLYAMSMRMAPLPTIPMPGFDRTHPGGNPIRPLLRTRRQIRDAIVAQTILRPAKSVSP